MKNFILIISLIGLFYSCKEEPIGQQPVDSVPPGPVTNPAVKRAIPGGVILTFNVPDDEDLLHVKAVYSRKEGVQSEAIVSLYTDTLMLVGFSDTSPREVKLYAVDRSRNESEPVSVTVTPLEPDVISIGKSLTLIADFGGVHAFWDNPNRAEISVVIAKKDNNDEYIPKDEGIFYSSMIEGDGAIRGMDTISMDFSVFVQDRWENQSEVQYYTLTPIFETQFDRLKFSNVELPGDAGTVGGWDKWKMWDGVKGAEQGYSSPAADGKWPHQVTINMGVEGRLSRIKIYQRTGNSGEYIYGAGNPRIFELWGCSATEFDGSTGSFDRWTKLMNCQSIKPSGLPITDYTNEDEDRARNGEDFVLPLAVDKRVQYLRIKVTSTWGGADNFQIGELEVFGDNR